MNANMISILPALLRLRKIHRILRILSLNTVVCTNITVGLLPGQKDPSDLCANRCFAGAALHSGAAALCAAVRGCTTAPPSLHLCISVSLSQRREWLTTRRLPGCILESAASVRCSLAPMRQVSLPPRLPPPTLLGLGAERDARRAHVVGGERTDIHTQERRERERAVSLVFAPHPYSPLLTSLLTPPSMRNRPSFPITTFLSSSNCIWDVHGAGNVASSYTFCGGLLHSNVSVGF